MRKSWQKMTRRRLVVGVVGLLAITLSLPALANNAWGEYHWDGSSTPVSLGLENNLSGAQWSGVLGDVETDWDTSGVLSLGIVSPDGSTNCADPLANTTPANPGLTEVCNGSYGQNGWLGVARIWLNADGVHISAAIAAVNDSYLGPGAAYDNANARRHVLCQEVGHTFGLDHQKSPKKQTCMNAQWGLTSSSFVSPNLHDYDQLASIYAHLDGTSEEGGNGGGPCDKKPDHPKCQAGSPGHSFEVERLANGQIMLTWITWAPGYGPDH